MGKLNHGDSNAGPNPVYKRFEDAVKAAKTAAKQSGEERDVHLGMAGFVALAHPTPGTVRIERPRRARIRADKAP